MTKEDSHSAILTNKLAREIFLKGRDSTGEMAGHEDVQATSGKPAASVSDTLSNIGSNSLSGTITFSVYLRKQREQLHDLKPIHNISWNQSINQYTIFS